MEVYKHLTYFYIIFMTNLNIKYDLNIQGTTVQQVGMPV